MDLLQKHIYKVLVATTLVVIGGGTVFYHYIEHWSWLDAYYFCIVTLATVGYGDLTPTTPLGKLFTTFYILGGVGIVTTFITFTLKRRAAKMESRHPSNSVQPDADTPPKQ